MSLSRSPRSPSPLPTTLPTTLPNTASAGSWQCPIPGESEAELDEVLLSRSLVTGRYVLDTELLGARILAELSLRAARLMQVERLSNVAEAWELLLEADLSLVEAVNRHRKKKVVEETAVEAASPPDTNDFFREAMIEAKQKLGWEAAVQALNAPPPASPSPPPASAAPPQRLSDAVIALFWGDMEAKGKGLLKWKGKKGEKKGEKKEGKKRKALVADLGTIEEEGENAVAGPSKAPKRTKTARSGAAKSAAPSAARKGSSTTKKRGRQAASTTLSTTTSLGAPALLSDVGLTSSSAPASAYVPPFLAALLAPPSAPSTETAAETTSETARPCRQRPALTRPAHLPPLPAVIERMRNYTPRNLTDALDEEAGPRTRSRGASASTTAASTVVVSSAVPSLVLSAGLSAPTAAPTASTASTAAPTTSTSDAAAPTKKRARAKDTSATTTAPAVKRRKAAATAAATTTAAPPAPTGGRVTRSRHTTPAPPPTLAPPTEKTADASLAGPFTNTRASKRGRAASTTAAATTAPTSTPSAAAPATQAAATAPATTTTAPATTTTTRRRNPYLAHEEAWLVQEITRLHAAHIASGSTRQFRPVYSQLTTAYNAAFPGQPRTQNSLYSEVHRIAAVMPMLGGTARGRGGGGSCYQKGGDGDEEN